MTDDDPPDTVPSTAPAGPSSRPVAACEDWRIAEYLCTAGPGDRSFEEQHDAFTMAAVVEGTFRYETEGGRSLMHPGSWLLGNHGECFTCGHDHSRGDRCVSLHVSPEYFAEVASSRAGTTRFRFASPCLPGGALDVSLMARACILADDAESIELDETVTQLIENIIARTAGAPAKPARVSALDEKRISRVLHHLEDHYPEILKLEDLAALAAMSKYHFLRTFRRAVGRSPYRYLLDLRLQHAAHDLVSSTASIARIALNCGFGDLSTFGLHFKREFDVTPSQFRARYSRKRG